MSAFTSETDRAAARVAKFLGLLVAVAGASCSALDPATDTCTDYPDTCDLAPGGGGTTGTIPISLEDSESWNCLNDPPPPRPMPANPTVTYRLPVVDWVGGAPIQDLVILKCANIDAPCNSSVGVVMPPNGRTDPYVAVDLDVGFKGFLKLVSPNGITDPNTPAGTANAYVPETYYFGDTIYANRTVETIIQVLRQPILISVAQTIGINIDFMKALLVLRVLDCRGKPAPDVTFKITGAGDPYTLIGGIPRRPDLGQDFYPTDADGQAGFANVPTGNVFVDAYIGETKINRDSVAATALAGQLTAVEVHARPWGTVPPASNQ